MMIAFLKIAVSTELCDAIDQYHLPNSNYRQITKVAEEEDEETLRLLLKLDSML